MHFPAHGKDLMPTWKAKQECGVRFVRSMVSRVAEQPKRGPDDAFVDSGGMVKGILISLSFRLCGVKKRHRTCTAVGPR
jgi:hypothetical protein